MTFSRRTFLETMAAGCLAGGPWVDSLCRNDGQQGGGPIQHALGPKPMAFSIIPVVADGRWIWATPPPGASGYLDPRPFDLAVGIYVSGTGNTHSILATTPVPVALAEQRIDETQLEPTGCQAQLRAVAPEAGQMIMAVPSLARGQQASAVARFRCTLMKDCRGFSRDRFPNKQTVPTDVKRSALGDSPGITANRKEVRDLAGTVASGLEHPWDQATAFYQWVWDHIRPQPGNFTSVLTALERRVGDCEERAAVFVALCRATGIPARLVWVPNHNWAEIFLVDHDGQGYWIPVHTAAYSWFGWTGAHELVLQKGDRIRTPEQHQPQRLLEDWFQWQGSRPEVRFTAELTPRATSEAGDPGPGARRKDARGAWPLVGNHPLDSQIRDGASLVARAQ